MLLLSYGVLSNLFRFHVHPVSENNSIHILLCDFCISFYINKWRDLIFNFTLVYYIERDIVMPNID